MDALQATDYLRRAVRTDDDVKLMVAAAVTAGGHADLFAWAAADPAGVILVAEGALEMAETTAEFDRRLSTGDLS
jgi:hypothetical protein